MKHITLRKTPVQQHYEQHVYPQIGRFSSIRGYDAYVLNVETLWAHFNGEELAPKAARVLLAGSGSFSPYPTAVANPQGQITALDLSATSLARAKWHTRLHLHFNVEFIQGDLLEARRRFGKQAFHFIDSYGVIHHIADAAAAGQVLHDLLQPGGVIRIMLYSKCARRGIESARHALQLLQINEVVQIKQLYRKAAPNSRFRNCLDATPDAQFDAGLADLFLHPYAKNYSVDDLLLWLRDVGLEPLRFAHPGALPVVSDEIIRLRELERARQLNHNFVLFAGRIIDRKQRQIWQAMRNKGALSLRINPVIKRFLPTLPFISIQPAPRLGFTNPKIDYRGHILLASLKKPRALATFTPEQRVLVDAYRNAMFLLEKRL